MKLISFDVGIKNMAYCVLSTTSVSVRIEHWGIINLVEEEPRHRCPCGKYAMFSKGDEYFCNKHSKEQIRWWVPSADNNWKTIKKKSMRELKTWLDDLNLLDENKVKMTRSELLSTIRGLWEEMVLQPCDHRTTPQANKCSLIEIGRTLSQRLDALGVDWRELTHVIIENQISPIASRMKTIQGMLTQYFILRADQAAIEYVSSTNKLGQFNRDGGNKTGYQQRKLDGIRHGLEWLDQCRPENNIWREWVTAQKKQDDLFDALLQGVAYIRR